MRKHTLYATLLTVPLLLLAMVGAVLAQTSTGYYPPATPDPANVRVIPVGPTSVIDDLLNSPLVVTPYPTAPYRNATAPGGFLSAGDTAVVLAGPLNVRSQPGGDLPTLVIGQLQVGEQVTVLSLSDTLEWAYVDTQGPLFTQGWVSVAYIEQLENFQAFAPSNGGGGGTGMTVRAVYTVNIRQSATLFSPRVGILPADSVAEIIGRKSTYGWWKVRLSSGVVGWVSSTYVRPEDPAAYYSVPVLID